MFDWLFGSSCQHKWKEIHRVFNQPQESFKAQGFSQETMLQLMYGVTIVELKCEICGEIKFKTTTGHT